jgi:2-oxoglutarate dehydrogenase E2 component (dihydrolipoamide succinyltransferase)
MSVELKVPQVGESITEVLIGDWLKQAGDSVAADEPVVVIETDKVTVELPAPAAGKVTKVLKRKGESAEVGEVIGYLEEGGSGREEPEGADRGEGGSRQEEQPPPEEAAAGEPARQQDEEPLVMPAAQRLLDQHGLAPADVEASGPGGRLLKEDVQRQVSERERRPARPDASAERGQREEVVPMTPLRKRIAERLVEAQRTSAILTTFNEIDLSAVKALREAQQQRFQERHGVKLGFMSFFVKAAVEALKRVPQVNAEIRDDAIVYHNRFDIGVAVGGGKGLVVPIVRDAERLSFAEVELTIADLAQRAQQNKLTLEELQGGTFTISNGGIYGSLLSTPILNPPQSGILGLHAIQDRPVVRDGQVVVRPMMYVALSYDHRLVDGREAVTFLKHVKECVEEPTRILLEV